ncbi:hypothetical protein [Rubellicoccus peritrichatus]|uniref:PEP-CTERM protein-sorting domain-containing protein n=1 Tax=Rubellicoccus peritrichatus TaxID=3080537 RepID=A0AAQ3LB92_9BACT|nr:hypothetical protein [Puniceicoccus sp. CR14]WOO42236.1 hypothetical protein RZN69_03980 [Puniceicoccus sp. CR14]
MSGELSPAEAVWLSGYTGDDTVAIVGISSDGSVEVTNGSTLASDSIVFIGLNGGSTGTVDLTGNGSSWETADYFIVGEYGNGSVDISNGASLTTMSTVLGGQTSGVGEINVTGSGSNLAAISDGSYGGEIYVGYNGVGTLNVYDGATVSAEFLSLAGFATGDALSEGSLTIDGAGSSVEVSDGSILIGDEGIGTMTVQNGGSFSSSYGSIGEYDTGDGYLVVTGSGSTFEITETDTFYVGYEGVGDMEITNGGYVTAAGDVKAGRRSNGSGNILVDGAGSTLDVAGELFIGDSGTAGMQIQNGGYVSQDFAVVGDDEGSYGEVMVSGSGSMWESIGISGYNDILVGEGGTGVVNVLDGGSVASDAAVIGVSETGLGEILISGNGSNWVTDNVLIVGDQGTGSVTISDGGLFDAGIVVIGAQPGSSGEVTVEGNGSELLGRYGILVGADGTGKLTVDEGAVVNSYTDITVGTTGELNVYVDGNNQVNAGATVDGDPDADFTNNGTTTLIASSNLAAGSYQPITATGSISAQDTGILNAVGGTWDDATSTFTVSEIVTSGDASGALGGQRISYGDNLLVAFAEDITDTMFTPTDIGSANPMIDGEDVLEAFDFDTTIVGSTVALTFDVGDGFSLALLRIWHRNGDSDAWEEFVADFVEYVDGKLTFTVTSFSQYGVTAVPEPTTTVAIFGAFCLAISLIIRRRRN